MRLIIVIRENLAEQANAVVGQFTEAGEFTFTNQLYNAQGTAVARWCNWDFTGTRKDAQVLAQRFMAEMGFTADEVGVRSNTTGANLATKKMLAFNAENVTPEQFLAFAGLHTDDAI